MEFSCKRGFLNWSGKLMRMSSVMSDIYEQYRTNDGFEHALQCGMMLKAGTTWSVFVRGRQHLAATLLVFFDAFFIRVNWNRPFCHHDGVGSLSHAPVWICCILACQEFWVLTWLFFHFWRINAIKANFYMELRRSQRQPKPKTIWEEKGAPSAARDPKITKRTDRTEQKTALKPVAVGPLPKTLEIDVNQLPDLPVYKPPLELQFEPSKSLLKGLSKLDTF